MRVSMPAVLILWVAASAAAQPDPIFDPDDSVDPRQLSGPVFISRLVAGGAVNAIDAHRPLDQNTAFLHLANSVYWNRFQLDYKHSEVFGEQPRWQTCGCSPPIYFPTPPSSDSTPNAPPPGRKETVQFGWYRETKTLSNGTPIMLRYRLSWSVQPIDTEVTSFVTGETAARFSGREQSFGLDADTHIRIRGRDVWGSLSYARTRRSGTLEDRGQNEFEYTNRFPAIPYKNLHLRATVTVGAVSGRGASGINVLSSAFEGLWYHRRSSASLHVVWNPQLTRSGEKGWTTTSQLAVFVDRKVYLRNIGDHDEE